MHVSSFVNNPDGVSLHSNEYAAGTVSARSFSQRREVERNRTVISAYMQSQIGTSYIDRSVLKKPKPRTVLSPVKDTNSRQETNSRTSSRYARSNVHSFREPSSRGHDPYS